MILTLNTFNELDRAEQGLAMKRREIISEELQRTATKHISFEIFKKDKAERVQLWKIRREGYYF
jgi:hypothetical protein